MSDEVDSRIAAMADAAALPRRYGELVFEAPWLARAFGIGVALCRCGLYEWSDFQRSLAEAISAGTPSAPERGY
ncbi:MAG: nitrile hydratase accessory protein, partial [Candidatus Binatia bacterium]